MATYSDRQKKLNFIFLTIKLHCNGQRLKSVLHISVRNSNIFTLPKMNSVSDFKKHSVPLFYSSLVLFSSAILIFVNHSVPLKEDADYASELLQYVDNLSKEISHPVFPDPASVPNNVRPVNGAGPRARGNATSTDSQINDESAMNDLLNFLKSDNIRKPTFYVCKELFPKKVIPFVTTVAKPFLPTGRFIGKLARESANFFWEKQGNRILWWYEAGKEGVYGFVRISKGLLKLMGTKLAQKMVEMEKPGQVANN